MANFLTRPMVERDLKRLGVRVDGEWIGELGERGGVIVGYSIAIWQEGDDEAAIGATALSSNVRPWWLPIVGKRFMERIAEETRLKRLITAPDCSVAPKSEEWLRWLGFAPTGTMFIDVHETEIWAKEI